MVSTPSRPAAPATDAYCVLGLATCYLREDSEYHPVNIIEPIPSAALEAILKQVPTSYQQAIALQWGDIMSGNQPQIPAAFPADAQFCDDFTERLAATARTYATRPEATQHIPLGTQTKNFNYSIEKKRVLNSTKIVKPEDNVKQHAHTHRTL